MSGACRAKPDRTTSAAPHEDAGVPVGGAVGEELGRSLRRGLLLEARHSIRGPAGVRSSRALGDDVAVARRGPRGLDAERDHVAACGSLGSRLEGGQVAGRVADSLVGGKDDHDLVVRTVDGLRGQRHGGRGVAPDGLTQHVTCGDVRDRFADQVRVAHVGDDEDVGQLDERGEPRRGRRQQAAAVLQQRQERLGLAVAAERPETGAPSPGQDDGVHADDCARGRLSSARPHGTGGC